MEKQRVIIKYVKKANAWCVTYQTEDKYKQIWFNTLPEAMKFRDKLKLK